MIKFNYVTEYTTNKLFDLFEVKGFSFYDTSREQYLNFMGVMIWENIEEFKFCFKRTGLLGRLSLEQYLELIPDDWKFRKFVDKIGITNDKESK